MEAVLNPYQTFHMYFIRNLMTMHCVKNTS